jgi:hypothetical protein
MTSEAYVAQKPDLVGRLHGRGRRREVTYRCFAGVGTIVPGRCTLLIRTQRAVRMILTTRVIEALLLVSAVDPALAESTPIEFDSGLDLI